MNIEKVKKILTDNEISETSCLINPTTCKEGALCLKQESGDRWTVTLNERGEYLIDKSFTTEDGACRYFLKMALIEPTNKIGFKPSDYHRLKQEALELVKKYKLTD